MNATSELENVVASNGATQNPIHLNGFVMVFNLICCIFGLPLNAFVAFLIIYMRRLRSKVRNIFLLGLVFSNMSAFIPVLIEFAYLHFPSDSLCRSYVAIVGLPYALFLINMLLALADRYAALAYPLWHMKKISIGLVIRWQIIICLCIVVVYKFPYVTQLLPLRCEVQLLQVRFISVTLFVLFFCCVSAQIVVYRLTKKILVEYRPKESGRKSVSTAAGAQQPVDTGLNNVQPTSTASGRLNVNISEHAISQMEMEATRTLIYSVMSLTIMTGPFILFTSSVFICRFNYEPHVCSSMSWLAPYLKELVVLHAVYHPLFFLCRSSEFSIVLKQRLNI